MTNTRLAQLAEAAELPVVLAIAPALFFPTPTRLLLLASIPIIWLCIRSGGGRVVPSTPLNASIFVMMSMVAVSLAATFDVRFSVGKVSGVALGVLLFWATTRRVTTPPRFATATGVFLLVGGGLAVVSLLGTNWVSKFVVFSDIVGHLPGVIRGVPGAEEGFSPNAVGGSLVLFVPLQVALLHVGGRQWLSLLVRFRGLQENGLVVLQILLLTLTVGTLLLTQSRGAWAGLIVAALVGVARFVRPVFALSAVASAIALAWVVGLPRVVGVAASQFHAELAGTVSARMELWLRAIYGIQDFPFTGMGMNAFRKVMPVFYPPVLTSPQVDVAHAHNQFLQAALDLGILGLVSYASIWLTVATLLFRVRRWSTDRAYRAMAGGLFAGLLAHFIFGLTDAIPLGAKVGTLFWLALALAVALHQTALPTVERQVGDSDRHASSQTTPTSCVQR